MYRYLLVLSVLMSSPIYAKNKIKVEPPNWWADMNHKQLQLMFHGESISHLTPKIEHPEVSIKSVHTTDNPNYIFIDLILPSKHIAGDIKISFYQNDVEIFNHLYPILKRQKLSKERKGFTSKDSIYLITPDRFANGDRANDQISDMKEGLNRKFKGGRHGGDLQGVIDHLPYIQEMGFTQIWLNPNGTNLRITSDTP